MTLLAKFLSAEPALAYRKPISRLLFLRTVSIAIQLISVIVLHFSVSKNDYVGVLLLVIAFETLFHLASIVYFSRLNATNFALALQILADISFLSLLLLYSGGATNAFVSLLLLPLIIAAVCLPLRWLAVCSLTAVSFYTLLVFNMPKHAMHHMDMQEHFLGMWINFVLSALVVTTTISALVKANANKERQMAIQREETLRSEQLMALGTAAAQVTHHLATPIANLQMIYEDLLDEIGENNSLINEMAQPLTQCTEQLAYFRDYASQIKENKIKEKCVNTVINEFYDACLLHFPEQRIVLTNLASASSKISSDSLLLSALINLVQNAVDANRQNQSNQIEINVGENDGQLNIDIEDTGAGFDLELLDSLGHETVKSQKGMGIALFLSNTTVNKLGGKLIIANNQDAGAKVSVRLPLL
ncbi:MAG: HAMP domain-containing sensor histidine kinase [Pseudomonadota bacterium]|nr:HAMP domain-containing sensor histidine kinase [Pseudomonadota bacterium]